MKAFINKPSQELKAKIGPTDKISVKSDPFTVRNISGLNDVDTTILKDGAMLVYNEIEKKWISTPILSNIEVESGQF